MSKSDSVDSNGPHDEARSREFWDHPYWATLFRNAEERRTLQLLAVESLRSREEYLGLLELVARAVRKYDPEYRLSDTVAVEEILSAVRSCYEIETDESGDAYVSGGDFEFLGKLHRIARRGLRSSANPIAARAIERTGAGVARIADWGRRLVAHLALVARPGLTGAELSEAVVSNKALWRHAPHKWRYVTLKDGHRGDLSHLDWDRFTGENAARFGQRPLAAALDLWCSETTLEGGHPDTHYEGLAVRLLARLGVDYKAAHNAVNAAENMKLAPSRQPRSDADDTDGKKV